MKAKDFGQFVTTFSKLLSSAGASDAASAWQQFLPLFTTKPEATIAQLIKAMDKLTSVQNTEGHVASKLISLIPDLTGFLEKPAKKAYITDLNNLATALKKHSNSAISEIVRLTLEEMDKKPVSKKSILRDELIASFVSQLERNLGNAEQFIKIVGEIKSGSLKVSVAEIKQIAVDFSKRSKSEVGSKTKALAAIMHRHEALMVGRAKSEATGSSIAA